MKRELKGLGLQVTLNAITSMEQGNAQIPASELTPEVDIEDLRLLAASLRRELAEGGDG